VTGPPRPQHWFWWGLAVGVAVAVIVWLAWG
jgi:hypothetical protein